MGGGGQEGRVGPSRRLAPADRGRRFSGFAGRREAAASALKLAQQLLDLAPSRPVERSQIQGRAAVGDRGLPEVAGAARPATLS